jgi:hypothetical protein
MDGLPSTLQSLETNLVNFREFLSEASRADETGD